MAAGWMSHTCAVQKKGATPGHRYNQKVLEIKYNFSDERNWKMVNKNILSKFDNNLTLQYSDGWMKNKGRGKFQ